MPVTRINHILRDGQPEQQITAKGWVRTRRDSKNGFSFIELNDGSCMKNLQLVVEHSIPGCDQHIRHATTGASLAVTGVLKESPGKGQRIELHATSIEVLGPADPQTYPLQKKGHTFEFLRDIAHHGPVLLVGDGQETIVAVELLLHRRRETEGVEAILQRRCEFGPQIMGRGEG